MVFRRVKRLIRSNLTKGWVLYLVSTSFILVGVELAALGLVLVLRIFDTGNPEIARRYLSSFHPLVRGKSLVPEGWVQFNPWVGTEANYPVHAGENLLPRKPNELRIFVLGGSTVQGDGVTVPEAIPARMELHLQQHLGEAYDIKVFNAGVAGWSSSEELLKAQFEILDQSPSLLVTIDGYNDLTRALQSQAEKRVGHERYWNRYHHRLKELVFPSSVRIPETWNVTRYLYSFDLLKRALVSMKKKGFSKRLNELYPGWPADVFYPLWTHQSQFVVSPQIPAEEIDSMSTQMDDYYLDAYVKNVRALSAIARANGVPYVHVLQPTLLTDLKKNMSVSEKIWLNSKTQAVAQLHGLNYGRFASEYLKSASQRLANEAKGNFIFADGTQWLNADEQMYTDWCHYNALSSDLIARNVVELIIPQLSKSESRQVLSLPKK